MIRVILAMSDKGWLMLLDVYVQGRLAILLCDQGRLVFFGCG